MVAEFRRTTAPTKVRTFDDLKALVGQELGVGDWLTMKQDRIDAFAQATGDHQWIHVDPQRAKDSPFGGTIAHGYLTLSLITLLRQGMQGVAFDLKVRMGVNYGSDRIRFIAPVRVGQQIRLRTMLLDASAIEPAVWQIKYRHTVEIAGESRPALVADTISRLYLDEPVRS